MAKTCQCPETEEITCDCGRTLVAKVYDPLGDPHQESHCHMVEWTCPECGPRFGDDI
jgi:hypothetical protein